MTAVRTEQTFTNVIKQPVLKLQSDAVLNSTYIFTSFANDEEISGFAGHQDQFIVCVPQQFPPSVGMQVGGGRNTLRLEGTYKIKVWNRLWTDEAGRDDGWLTDSTNGIGPLLDSILQSLEMHDPLDGNGNYYYTQPFRLLPPGWVFPPKKVGDWGVIESNWSLHYWQLLT